MVWNSARVTFFFMLLTSFARGQVNRYMIFLKDKDNSVHHISVPTTFLSQRAIDRRLQNGIAITEQDIPVNQNYVELVRKSGATPFFTSRWMNGVLVQCDASLLATLQSLDVVDRIEYVAPNPKLQAGGRRKITHKSKGSTIEGKTQAQLQLIGLDEMQAAGYRGESIHIAIFDSGFQGVNITEPFAHIFEENRIDVNISKDFVFNSDDVFQYDEHGTEVFSVIAAYQEQSFTGGSYEASYQLYVTEDVSTEYRIEEYNWLFAAERADSAGVDIINSSLGYYDFDDTDMNYPKSAMDGKTTVISRAAQWASERGIIVVCSAGNEGGIAWQIITAPADAKDVLAIASVNSSGLRANTSSKGPSADGRIKPDVAAMGVNTSVIKPDGSTGNASGTSLSCPLITSLAAGVWQRYPSMSNLEVIEAIRYSSSQANSPDNLIGYGIPNFKAVVNYVESHPQENVFEIFPNPVLSDTFTIKPSDPTLAASCRVELVSSHGQVLFNTDVDFSWLNRTYTGNLSNLSAGFYFLRIWWGDKRYIYRLIKV